MLIPNVYLICQVTNPKSFRPEMLEHWNFSSERVTLCIDTLDESMKILLQGMASKFTHISLRYFVMDPPDSNDRKFLLSLESNGIDVNIEHEPFIGLSSYAVLRRYKSRINDADHVLIVYDKLNKMLQNLLAYVQKRNVDSHIICSNNQDQNEKTEPCLK